MNSPESITGAQYAERLLSVKRPQRSIDRLLEKLSPVNRDLKGWESHLLELKACYRPSPDFPDDIDFDQPECFEWNVVHAFIALANAQGGCVVLGIAETADHKLVKGDWDPEQIISEYKGPDMPRTTRGLSKGTREIKDLIAGTLKRLLSDDACKRGRKFRFEKRSKDRSDKPVHLYGLTAQTVQRLRGLIQFYDCHSDLVGCDALAVIVNPIAKGEALLEVERTVRADHDKGVVFYRDSSSAQTLEIRSLEDYERYKNTREPASSQFLDELSEPLQKVPRAHSCVFSTVPQPVPTFTGRTEVLERIRKLCQEGRIPLVQAAGGTGKTQVILRYAQQYSDFYPGGRFFLQLDNVQTWKQVLSLLTPLAYNMAGMTPRQWLGLPEYVEKKDEQGNSIDEKIPVALTEEEVIGALARKSQETGPVLVILDNLDDPEKLLSQPVLSGVFPCGIPANIHFMVTSRTAEHITARRTPAIALVDLPDLSEDEAVQVLCGETPSSPEEESLAREISRLLGCRALYLQRISWLIDDERANDNPAPLTAVRRILATDLLEAVQPQDNDVRTPAVLWKWFQSKLGKEADSGKLIALLRAIAFYPPAGMPLEILEGLWHSDFGRITGRAMLENVGDGTFERAIQIFLRHKIVTKDETSNRIMMHRLDRLAIQEDTKASVPGDIERIGKALAVNPCCSPADWVEIAPACPEWISCCPRELLNGDEFVQILLADPSCDGIVEDWSMISPDGWVQLFSASSSFDDHPACPWHLLDPVKLTVARTDIFLTRYDRSQVVKEEWLEILFRFPDLYSSCPNPVALYLKRRTPRGVRNYTTSWGMLLQQQPQLAAICQFEELDVDDWVSVLCHTPQHGEKFPSDKFQGHDWARVLAKQPQMIDLCPVEKLSDSDLFRILEGQPGLAERFNLTRLHQMNIHMWIRLLSLHPELEVFFPQTLWAQSVDLGASAWQGLIESQPKFIDRYLAYGCVDGKWRECNVWVDILRERPKLVDRCPFDQFGKGDWTSLLNRYADYVAQLPVSVIARIEEKIEEHYQKPLSSLMKDGDKDERTAGTASRRRSLKAESGTSIVQAGPTVALASLEAANDVAWTRSGTSNETAYALFDVTGEMSFGSGQSLHMDPAPAHTAKLFGGTVTGDLTKWTFTGDHSNGVGVSRRADGLYLLRGLGTVIYMR